MDDHAEPARYARSRVFATPHAPVFANRIVLDGDFELHSHDFIEILLVGGGCGIHDTVRGWHPLSAGSIWLLQPGVGHAYSGCRQLEVYNCCFGVEVLQRELLWIRDDPLLNHLFAIGPVALSRGGILSAYLPDVALASCCQHLGTLQRLCRAGSTDNNADLIGHLLLILAQFAHHMDHGYRAEASRPVHQAVAGALRLMEDDPAYPWSLPDLAGRLHIDRSYLVRLCTAHTGLSPMAYLGRHRAERAATLLLQIDRPVAEVGREVGWPDPNYFARRFKAHFGLSASAYRARHAYGDSQPDHTHHHSGDPARSFP